MKILRLTQHATTDTQVAALQRIFGEVTITQTNETLPMLVKDAVSRFDMLSELFDVVEVVLPTNLVEGILKFSGFSKRGGILIRAIMLRTIVEEKAIFVFSGDYEKIVKVEIVTEML